MTTTNRIIQIAAFASGRGSNLRAVDDYLVGLSEQPARIALCVSNNPNAGVFEHAEERGIPRIRLSPKMYPENPGEYELTLIDLLEENGIDLILLAGYMRKLPEGVVRRWRGRILNVHPALLPAYGGKGMYGMHVHTAVLEAGEKESGATVHLADEEYDTGAVLARKRVPVERGDTPESLAARVLVAEHWLFPRVVERAAHLLAQGESIRPEAFDDLSA